MFPSSSSSSSASAASPDAPSAAPAPFLNNGAGADGCFDAKEEAAVEQVLSRVEGDAVTLQAKWKTHAYSLRLPLDRTVAFLKMQIAIHTNVKPAHQKLIMRVKGKLDDLQELRSLSLKDGDKLLIVGNEEKDMPADRQQEVSDDVVDDLEDTEYGSADSSIRADPEHRRKLDKYKGIIDIAFISPQRPGKRLLVLDLDYTLFDMKTQAEDFTQLRRPFTHRFLSALYAHYELVIWSQTSWRWLEMKLTELGLLTHPHYRILFVLDKSCMFRVTAAAPTAHSTAASASSKQKHHVKALELIWHKLPAYSAANTVHVDDLGRNFAMNPQSGLKIRAYKHSQSSRQSDRELLYLQEYLLCIAQEVQDFSTLDHSLWKEYIERRGRGVDTIDREWRDRGGNSSRDAHQ